MTDWRENYQRKLVSAEEAVNRIESGDRVFFTAGRQPQALGLALASRKDYLRGVTILVPTPDRDFGWYDPGWEEFFQITLLMPTAASQQMVDENCASADRSGIGKLNDDDLEVINKLIEVYRKRILVPCTACGYCMPCPSGVNIPQNFAILNNVSVEGSRIRRWLVSRGYGKLARSKKQLKEDDSNGSAVMCVQCSKCLEKCPQEINIPEELKKVHAILGKHKKITDYYR